MKQPPDKEEGPKEGTGEKCAKPSVIVSERPIYTHANDPKEDGNENSEANWATCGRHLRSALTSRFCRAERGIFPRFC